MGDGDLKQVCKLLMKGGIFIFVIGAFVGGCMYFNYELGIEDDHPIEQLIEDIVEFHLELPKDSIDLTPED